jgi:hypothetical protein
MLLAITAEKFGCRPSAMVGLRDAVLALDFDLASAARLLGAERAAAIAATEGSNDAALASRRAKSVYW